MSTAVVFIGGAAPHPGVVAHLPEGSWVVAADSGYDHAVALGVHVDLVVGDLDSVSAEGLARIEREGTLVLRFPTDKAFTDTELALQAAVDHGARSIVVVSCVGDRVDHSFAALVSLVDLSLAGIDVEAWWGEAHVYAMRGPAARRIPGTPGETFSIIPVDGPAQGLTLEGARWPLDHETLSATASRGVSNLFGAPFVNIAVERGALLVIIPHALRHGAAGRPVLRLTREDPSA